MSKYTVVIDQESESWFVGSLIHRVFGPAVVYFAEDENIHYNYMETELENHYWKGSYVTREKHEEKRRLYFDLTQASNECE